MLQGSSRGVGREQSERNQGPHRPGRCRHVCQQMHDSQKQRRERKEEEEECLKKEILKYGEKRLFIHRRSQKELQLG